MNAPRASFISARRVRKMLQYGGIFAAGRIAA